jgi:hypothetical protein
VENGSEHWAPKWGESQPLMKNITYLKSLYTTGKYQFILCTSRPEAFREATEIQLRALHFPFDQVLYGMNHCQRILVNDFAITNPYPTAQSITVGRNADDLENYTHILE